MASTTAPKLTELQAKVFSLLKAIPQFVAAATKASKDPITKEHCLVVADDGTRKARVDDLLREIGFAVIIRHPIGWDVRDQSGSAWLVEATIVVNLRTTPHINNKEGDRGGANIDPLQGSVYITNALCGGTRHPGGEFFKIGKEGSVLDGEDGLGYHLFFTKECQL